MRVVVVPVGGLDGRVLDEILTGLSEAFEGSVCTVSEYVLPVPRGAYNPSRKQYISTRILSAVLDHAEKMKEMTERLCRVLGVTDVDLYVPGMNFVFGEAQCPGKVALISLYRLRPEFYGEPPDEQLFLERSLKETVHEIGHTLGLRHCPDPLCVMHFSLHIGMTDRKQHRFCERCSSEVERTVSRS